MADSKDTLNPTADRKAADLAALVAELVASGERQAREDVAARVVATLKKATEPAPIPNPAAPFHKFDGWAHKGITQFATAAEVARFVYVTSERIEPLLEVVRDHMGDKQPAYAVGVLLEAAMEAAWQVAQASNALIAELDPINRKPGATVATEAHDLLHDINARLLDLLPMVSAIVNEADTVPSRDKPGSSDNVTGPAHRIASLGGRIDRDVRAMLQDIEAHV